MSWQGKGREARLAAACLLGVALVCVSGCPRGKAVVSGKVTLKDGTPVSNGTITFWPSDGRPASNNLKSDGTYVVADAPVGDVKVTIVPPAKKMSSAHMPAAPPGQKGMPKEMIPEGDDQGGTGGKIVAVPEKYKDHANTPLTYTVTRGSQTQDFVLEP